jgi:G:T/U-mismatch repair DNA glycosylase
MRTLPDYLRKGMKMILIGANPGDRSARVGHYYAGRGNQFWPIMYESGVIPEPLSYEDDRRILEFGIGMTDLVKRPHAAWTSSSGRNSLKAAYYSRKSSKICGLGSSPSTAKWYTKSLPAVLASSAYRRKSYTMRTSSFCPLRAASTPVPTKD